MVRRTSLGLALLALLALTSCSPQVPFTESFHTAVPRALLESDLGITEAEADNINSGLSVSLYVGMTLDRDSITAEELTEVIELIVENNNITNLHELHLLAKDGTADDDYAWIDLSIPGAELGLNETDSGVGSLNVDWDELVAFVRER